MWRYPLIIIDFDEYELWDPNQIDICVKWLKLSYEYFLLDTLKNLQHAWIAAQICIEKKFEKIISSPNPSALEIILKLQLLNIETLLTMTTS